MGIKLYHNGEWVEFGGNLSSIAAGNNKQVQFNDNGSLAGADGLEFEKDTNSPHLTLKPASTQASGIHGGNIRAESTINTGTTPWSSTTITADGGLELFRTRISSPRGGPYIDYVSQEGSDFDARIQMDYANGNVDNGAINPSSADYSSLTFATGGNGYYDAGSNQNGKTVERLRIGKNGEIGIEAGDQMQSTASPPYNNIAPGLAGSNNPIVLNTRTDAQKYGSSGAVIVSNGKGSSVSWSKQPVASAYVNFDGTTNTGGNCTMRDAYGVSSVGDLGTGSYRINWTSNFPNVNYTVTVSHSQAPNNGSTHGVLYTNGYAVDHVNVINFADNSSGNLVDKNTVCVVVHTTHT